ncbi:MAG: hypothetical protein RLZZ41_202, partial [Actinomycetota bacterium]
QKSNQRHRRESKTEVALGWIEHIWNQPAERVASLLGDAAYNLRSLVGRYRTNSAKI